MGNIHDNAQKELNKWIGMWISDKNPVISLHEGYFKRKNIKNSRICTILGAKTAKNRISCG